jgi:hypothetical protein
VTERRNSEVRDLTGIVAASDYLLVPTTINRKAMDRVPVLIGRFLKNEHFRKNINQDLK